VPAYARAPPTPAFFRCPPPGAACKSAAPSAIVAPARFRNPVSSGNGSGYRRCAQNAASHENPDPRWKMPEHCPSGRIPSAGHGAQAGPHTHPARGNPKARIRKPGSALPGYQSHAGARCGHQSDPGSEHASSAGAAPAAHHRKVTRKARSSFCTRLVIPPGVISSLSPVVA